VFLCVKQFTTEDDTLRESLFEIFRCPCDYCCPRAHITARDSQPL